MLKSFVNTLNWVFAIVWAATLGFLCLGFFLGAREDKLKLVEEPFLPFLGRFAIAGLAGVLGIGVLVLINFFLNRTILDGNHQINLKELFIKGSLVVLASCFVGTLVFILT
jgi:hypothetical protein